MRRLKLLFSFGPKGQKDHPTDNVSDDDLDVEIGFDRPIIRLRRILRNIRIYTLGTAVSEIVRPRITSADCFWILINLHLNIRFVVQYIDLSLEWGGFLVWLIFATCNVTICSWLGFIYTFLGSYGDSSYYRVWNMMPAFGGITFCVTLIEMMKMAESSLILASGLMSFAHFLHAENVANAGARLPCNRTKYTFEPAVGVLYGFSKRFTELGYDLGGANRGAWRIDQRRVHWMVFVYACVVLLRFTQFKRYRLYALRGNAATLFVVVLALIFVDWVSIPNPNGTIIHYEVERYTNLRAYMQIVVFSLIEYLPMHWVTVGFLCPDQPLMSKIWIVASLKILVAFLLLFWIPYLATDFGAFVNVERTECLQFFGIHFLFAVIPLNIKSRLFASSSSLAYAIYFVLLVGYGVTNILLSLDLMVFAFMTQRMLYRYRNLMHFLLTVLMILFTYPFCIETTHYFLFYLNIKSHCYTVMIVCTFSVAALAIYGLDRINGDHLFMRGVLYPNITALKQVFIVNFALVLLFVSEGLFNTYRADADHFLYYAIVALCVSPLLYGVVHTCAYKSAYHGFCQPKSCWGMPSAALRNQRRRKTFKTMYTYRMKRDCPHNCLIGNPVLARKIDRNLSEQEETLGLRRVHILRLAIDRMSKQSTN